MSLKKNNTRIETLIITNQQIGYLINLLKNGKDGKDVKFYYFVKRFRLLENENEPIKLIAIDEDEPDSNKILVSAEDMFDVCNKVHKSIGYQGRDAMINEAKKFYSNVTRPNIELFLRHSEEYQLKRRPGRNHGLVVKPITSTNFNSRMQIDLVDFQSLPDGDFK